VQRRQSKCAKLIWLIALDGMDALTSKISRVTGWMDG